MVVSTGTSLRSEIKFGTDGWRAIMCDTFTFGNVRMVVQAIADYLISREIAHRGVIVGHDPRFLGERFAREAASVLAGNGIRVMVTDGDAPTPTVAHAVADSGAAGAIMFTASHNPPEYNGIKWIPEYAGPAFSDVTSEIERRIAEVLRRAEGALGGGDSSTALHGQPEVPPAIRHMDLRQALDSGLVRFFNPKNSYIQRVKSLLDVGVLKRSGLRVIYDSMHGAGRGYVDQILGDLGCRVESIHGTREALFGGIAPEPTIDRLPELARAMECGAYDIGLATDGDADRFGVVDAGGVYIYPNQVISLLLVHLARTRMKLLSASGRSFAVVRTVATTHLIDALAKAYGLELLETPVGFKYICKHMREREVLIGGEESGGLSILGHIPEKDGILADCLMAELRAVSGKPFTSLLREIMEEHGFFYTRRVDLHIPAQRKQELMDELRTSPPEAIAGSRVERIVDIDGVKFIMEDGSWALVRPSGTEPLVRIYAEASSEGRLSDILKEFSTLVEK